MSDPGRRAVVTGLGAITPIGNDAATFWQNLADGVSGVGPIRAYDAANEEVRIAAEVTHSSKRRTMTLLLWPPRPIEFDRATRTSPARAVFGT